LYTQAYRNRAKRLLRQLLRDGHCGRTAKFALGDIGLMRCFKYERPTNNRLLQKMYTASRIIFDSCQMAKLFPGLAWHEFIATLLHAAKK
jgi:hypothetical protein